MKRVVGVAFVFAGLLASCGNTPIVQNQDEAQIVSTNDLLNLDVDGKADLSTQKGELTAQQTTYCYGTGVQNVHKGFYQEPANSGIYPIKAKANLSCLPELTNFTVYAKISVLRLSGGNWVEVGAAESQGQVGTDGLNLFLQANVPCVNGTYKSKLYIKRDPMFWWMAVVQDGESAVSTVSTC